MEEIRTRCILHKNSLAHLLSKRYFFFFLKMSGLNFQDVVEIVLRIFLCNKIPKSYRILTLKFTFHLYTRLVYIIKLILNIRDNNYYVPKFFLFFLLFSKKNLFYSLLNIFYCCFSRLITMTTKQQLREIFYLFALILLFFSNSLLCMIICSCWCDRVAPCDHRSYE